MDRVDGRGFLVAAGTLLAAPLVVEAQQAAKVTRIGYLSHNLAASPTCATPSSKDCVNSGTSRAATS